MHTYSDSDSLNGLFGAPIIEKLTYLSGCSFISFINFSSCLDDSFKLLYNSLSFTNSPKLPSLLFILFVISSILLNVDKISAFAKPSDSVEKLLRIFFISLLD